MGQPDKLPLLKNAFRMLVDRMQPEDTVSLVVYAGSAGTVLEPTPVREKGKILAALDRLEAGGSTAGGEGIRQAYALAESSFDPKGVNRVILATDGDFNVGIRDPETLQHFVEREREKGVFLSVLGFGQGNYNDALMQKLAQNGNGNAAYIDTLNEARKVLVEEAASHPLSHCQGREDPGGVQPGPRGRVPPHRVRVPEASPRGFQQRPGGCRGDRGRAQRDRPLRDHPDGEPGPADRRPSLRLPVAGDPREGHL